MAKVFLLSISLRKLIVNIFKMAAKIVYLFEITMTPQPPEGGAVTPKSPKGDF
jgi:hypothetical protein